MVRLKDVAYLAGYDISTVSKVLQGGKIHASEEARQRILKAADELGYRPNLAARALRTRRSGAIVMAFPKFGDPVHPALTQGAEEAANRLGQAFLVYKYPEPVATEALLNLVLQGRADGIIVSDDLPEEQFLPKAAGSKIPIVTLNRQAGEVVPSVVLDDEEGFTVQASYLLGLGHSQIAFVAVHPESQTSQFCMAAFLETCAAAGHPVPEDRILSCLYDGSDVQPGIRAILGMNPRPTAIATASLVTAMRIIQGLVEAGIKVPQEMSVIGYHDSPMGEWSTPQTTTIRMPSVEQGARSVERLCALIAGEPGDMQEIVSTPIMVVERGSCSRVTKR
ncbi:MAG: LacI family DNA-binding transcriptional regulator [Armatimonadetes bacterium]|nr:LacI family DNA-binding transcriptional regulator [Armatimonadota bacterium]